MCEDYRVCLCSMAVDEHLSEGIHKEIEAKEEAEKVSLQNVEKEREKRRKSSREVAGGHDGEVGRREGRSREHRKTKKVPPKKVQKLHNLTGDLLFQVSHARQVGARRSWARGERFEVR